MAGSSGGNAQPPGSPGRQTGRAGEAWDDNHCLSFAGRPTQVPGKSGWLDLPVARVSGLPVPSFLSAEVVMGPGGHGSNLNMEITF